MARFETKKSNGSSVVLRKVNTQTTDLIVDQSFVKDHGDTAFVMIDEFGHSPASAAIWLDRDETVAFAYQLLRLVEEFDQQNAD